MASATANTLECANPVERAGGWNWWRLVRVWHLSSLDAPTVAVVWAWAFAWAAHVRLAVWPLALLGLAVWAVYIGDRLLDARAGIAHPANHNLRERHHFHWRHRRILAPLAVAAGLAAVGIVCLRVPDLAIPQDSAVALATLAYFSGVHTRPRLPVARALAAIGLRECVVGVLFAAGCALPAWSMGPGAAIPARLLALTVMYFAALAWLNVRAINHWESPASQRLGSGFKRAAWGLAAAGALLAAALIATDSRGAVLLAAGAASALMIGWLDRRRKQFSALTLRVAVDAALLTPVLLAMAARLAR